MLVCFAVIDEIYSLAGSATVHSFFITAFGADWHDESVNICS